jgi:hypothetical protein
MTGFEDFDHYCEEHDVQPGECGRRVRGLARSGLG